MVCAASRSGRRIRSTLGLRPAQIPSGIPISERHGDGHQDQRQGLHARLPQSQHAQGQEAQPCEQRHLPAGEQPADHGGGGDDTDPGHPQQDVRHTIEERVEEVLQRGQEVDEQRARLVVLDHPGLDVGEPSLRVDHPSLGEPIGELQRDDRRDHDGADPDQATSPRVRRRRDDDLGWSTDLDAWRRRSRRCVDRRHAQCSSTKAAITALRSTAPSTWSPSTTRNGRSEEAKCGISSCTIVDGVMSPP